MSRDERQSGAAFVGREDALSWLRGALARTRAERGRRQLVIEGEAGIGKTALIGRFLGELPAGGAVRVTAEEAEEHVDHAVADALLRRLGVAAPDVVPEAGQAPDLARVGLLLLERLGDAASRPLVLVIDDAQWADGASLRALLFALRRLDDGPLLVVLGMRSGTLERLPAGLSVANAGERLGLTGMSATEVAALASARGVALPAGAARTLGDHTGGNPLYVGALLDEVPVSAWAGGEPLPPAPELFARNAARRLDAVADDTRALVEAAAVLGVRSELRLAAAVAGLANPLDALELAEISGLVVSERDSGQIEFDHPLTRAAIYHGIGAARSVRLHVAAAAAVTQEGSALRHRAAAAAPLGADPALADELERFAHAEIGRGAWESAADCLGAAARLSVGGERERRELEAADALLGAGRLAAAQALLHAPGATENALRDCVRAHVALQQGRGDEAELALARAWEGGDGDRYVRARVAERRAVVALGRLRPAEVITWTRRSAALGENARDALLRRWPEALAFAADGRPADGRAIAEQIVRDGGELAVSNLGYRWIRASLRLLDDDHVGALGELRAVAAAARESGSERIEIAALASLARAELASGSWDEAALHAERAFSIAVDGGHDESLAEARTALFEVAVVRGELSLATKQVDALALTPGMEWAHVRQLAAAARLAAADGRPRDVLATLDRLRAEGLFEAAARLPELALPALGAEALARLGRHDEAAALLEPFEARAAQLGQRSFAVSLARARARVETARGRHAQAQCAVETALREAAALELPYELALAQLSEGELLRRRGERRRALTVLSEARVVFVALGAAPALARCERELEGGGGGAATRATALTGRERAVAQLASRGLTNREIGAELMVSVKTVEVHLSRVFGRLGISSRDQLAARLDEG